jgi:carboxypeptidase C (cathepsin A)
MKALYPLLLCFFFLTLPLMAQQSKQPLPNTLPNAPPKADARKPAATQAAPTKAEQPKTSPTTAEQPKPELPLIERSATDLPDAMHAHHQRGEAAKPNAAASAATAENVDETPIVTHHKITVGGKTLAYTATAAQMPIKNSHGDTEAHIFYMAYTLDGADLAKRPLTFAFNGGPGSASIWVHMGAMGPRSPKLMDNGDMPPPPFQLIDDEFTWLDQTDLVFIDPVGTGYSRAKTPEIAHQMNGVRGDIQSVGELIRMYITRNERWLSPLFIAGESYGTFRAAGLAGTLIDKGIALNGIVLISTVLDMGALDADLFNGLPYALHLPTFAADAWYHKKLPADLQNKDLRAVLKEAEHWAMNDYVSILDRGSDLTADERKSAIAKLAGYTGLEPRYIDDSDLRIGSGRFNRELLHDRKLIIGGYDGRLTAPAPLSIAERSEFDPSGTLIRPPFEAAFQQYIRAELGYKTDMVYNVLAHLPWDWESTNGYAETTGLLRSAFMKNPHFKVMVCAGYYDDVTPYFSVEYTFHHLGLHAETLKNVDWQYYEAGHMMYIDRESHRKLKRDITDFIKRSLPQP